MTFAGADKIIRKEATAKELLEKLLSSYSSYYTVNREAPPEPFAAEAVFSLHGENYFLLKAARYAEMNSNEYVFFAVEENLDAGRLAILDSRAWELCLQRTKPEANHRNTDAVLIIIADTIDPAARQMIRKLRHYKSYRFGLRGWNAYKIIAIERSSGSLVFNPLGRTLEKLFE